MTSKKASVRTRAVHAGERQPRGDWTPVSTPITPSVGYTYESSADQDAVLGAERAGYVYTRYGSPTVAAFEHAVASLEEGEAGYAFASGMAAIHVALLAAGAKAGVSIVAATDLYGATHSLLQNLFAGQGIETRFVEVTNLTEVETALNETHAAILVAETISNPLLKIADIPRLAELAHQHSAQLLVDNTFASPYLFTPLVHGADFAIHSATKYLGGHGDLLAGVVVTSAENRKRLYELNKMVGSVLGPFEAWLGLRGLKTLPLRMKQQCENALQIAEWLEGQPRVEKVNYPGLPGHPQHNLARQLFQGRGYGGVLSFQIRGGAKAAVFKFMEALRLIQPATTLGDVYSLVLHPATASHRALTPEERQRFGIRENLVRLSAGIEDFEDLRDDLEQAMATL